MNSLLNIGIDYEQSSDEEEQSSEEIVQSTCVWEECFDENTKYPYYWNTKTDKVTWEMPAEYSEWLEAGRTNRTKATKSSSPTIKTVLPVPDQPKSITSEIEDGVSKKECQRTNSNSHSNQKRVLNLPNSTNKRKRRIDFDILPKITNNYRKVVKVTNETANATEPVKSNNCDIIVNETSHTINEPKTETESETTKKSIIDIYSLLDDKINFFIGGNSAPKSLSSIQVMQIELNTLKTAFDSESLKKDYFVNWLTGLSNHLLELEENAAPDGWTCSWKRDEKRYVYTNTKTGVISLNYPNEVDEEKESDSTRKPTNTHESSDEMDISDPDSPVRTLVQNSDRTTIDDELNNFYSDIATIENE